MNHAEWNDRAQKLMAAKQAGYITSREYEREFDEMYQQAYGHAFATVKHPKKGG